MRIDNTRILHKTTYIATYTAMQKYVTVIGEQYV